VRLAVGNVVVYAAYGEGRIVAREKRVSVGADEEIVVLELAQGPTVTLPLERAHRQLRPPVDELDMRRVQQTLREDWTLARETFTCGHDGFSRRRSASCAGSRGRMRTHGSRSSSG